jgi:hypothetical protein
MNLARAILSKAVLVAMPLGWGALVGASGEAHAQSIPPPPSAAYIATTQPEYFDGRPVYWYHNYWYYHDGGRWNFYRDEPLTLRGLRDNWRNRPRYHYYR